MASRVGRKKLPRPARLTASGDIRNLIRKGRRHPAGPYVVHGLPAEEEGGSRLAVVVPRRVGNQVVRNRIKRLFREAFRLERSSWPRHWDLVVYVRSSPGEPTLEEATLVLGEALKALGARPPKESEER